MNQDNLISIKELIHLFKEPKRRGLIPHSQRKQAQAGQAFTVGHYPAAQGLPLRMLFQSSKEIAQITQSGSVLAGFSANKFLQLNSRVKFKDTELILSGDEVNIDQDLRTTDSPTFTGLKLTGQTGQIGVIGTNVITLPQATGTVLLDALAQTITNKTISGSSNTLTNIPNSALSNSKITINPGANLSGGGDISLGGSGTLALKDDVSISTLTTSGLATLNTVTVSGIATASSMVLTNPSKVLVVNNSGVLGTLTWSPTVARTVTIPNDSASNADICLTSGNCSGVGGVVGGTGTANYLAKWSSTTNITTGLLYDNGNGVGLSTTIPLAKFDVVGGSTTSAIASFSGSTGKATLTVDNTVGDLFTASSSGLSRFVITNSGNVGIGTTGPGAKLHILDASKTIASGDTNVFITTNDAGAIDKGGSLSLGGYRDAASTVQIPFGYIWGRKENSTDNNGNGYLAFGTRDDSAAAREWLRITSQGNVGIGTTSPSSKLHVVGQCVTADTLIKVRRRRKKKNGEFEDEWVDVPIKDINVNDEILTLDDKTGEFVVSKVEKLMDKGSQEVFELITESGKTIETTAKHPYFVWHETEDLSFLQRDSFERTERIARKYYFDNFAGSKIYCEALDEEIHFTEEGWNHFVQKKRSINDLIIRFFALPRAPYVLEKGRKVGYDKVRKEKMLVEYWELQEVVENVLITVVVSSINHGPKFFLTCRWLGTKEKRGLKAIKKELSLSPSAPQSGGSDRRRRMVTSQLFSKLTIPKNAREVKWAEVRELEVGQKIATVNGWERIIAITPKGRKHTWDLQIANTHNFVGNGIVAHNTYLAGGNLTAPIASLSGTTSFAGLVVDNFHHFPRSLLTLSCVYILIIYIQNSRHEKSGSKTSCNT